MICVLTYRRVTALRTMLAGLKLHCPNVPIHVFEDCGNRDGTSKDLAQGPMTPREELMADEYQHPNGYTAYLGHINLGVAGNSNRAIKVFMDSDCDQLLLLNDDLHILGNFVDFYGKAHRDLGIGFFCFNDFWESETHRWAIARSRGYRVKIFPRYTGIMLSVLRRAINKVGYFDTRFGKFGEEHSDYTNRMRFAGELRLDGQDQMCLDVEPTLPDGKAGPPVLKHQDVLTSVTGPERKKADEEAAVKMLDASHRYHINHYYLPFRLLTPPIVAGINNQGTRLEDIPGYTLVNSCA